MLELEPDQKLERESELLELLDPQSNRPPEEAVLERRGRLLAVANSEVMIGSARVVAVDIKGSNGVIHVIDEVLLPKS